MFWRRKQIQPENVHNFNEAIKAIKVFIYLKEWEKAEKTLKTIREKENKAFGELEYQIRDDYKELQRQKRAFDKNMATISKYQNRYEIEKIKYERKIEAERFKIRFRNIKKEIKKLVSNGENNAAINILNNFLEENKEKTEVASYYAREKKRVLKNIRKSQLKDKKKIQDNKDLEAIKIANQTLKTQQEEKDKKLKEKQERKDQSFFWKIKYALNFQKRIRESYKRKKLLDEVRVLLEEESKVKQELATKKLENIHKGLIKEIEKKNMIGYDLYGKILGSDKISGDSFGFYESKHKYTFYIGDATGHGVRAGLIISLLSKTFQEEVSKDDIINLTLVINNTLKKNLQSKNFVTGLFFEFDKSFKNAFNVSGMGHEPLLIYRAREQKIEKIIAWGLAGGIRLIKKPEDIKPKTLNFHKDDIILTYSDGVLEAKWENGEIYGVERLEKIFLQSASINTNVKEVYNDIIEDLKLYRWGTNFSDDTTILLFRRNTLKDIINTGSEEIEKIRAKEWLTKKEVKRLEGKTKSELEEVLGEIKKEKQTKNIVSILKWLYLTGEFLKLKEESKRYIKEGFVDKDINYYLKKAIENEDSYRIKQKNTNMENKYNVLVELLKKQDYNTVIREANEIIAKDWNI